MPLPQITWDYVQQLPDDGNRYEAIEGDLYVTPAPSVRHQTILKRLHRELMRVLEDPSHGDVGFAPLGVHFPATGEGVQPDLLFVSNERRGIIAPYELKGAPDLVVEILSPTTASRDTGLKLVLYERQGVGEYWIVDPDAAAVDVWRFEGEPRTERFVDRLPVRLADEPVGEIDLGDYGRRIGGNTGGADVRRDGRLVALLTYDAILLYERSGGHPLPSGPVARIGLSFLRTGQVESIAFLGDSLVFGNEGRDLFFIEDPLDPMWAKFPPE